MTIAELYNWAKKNNVENIHFEIQDGDGGGYYGGTHEPDPDVRKYFDEIKVVL